jgi:hypothetical protein
MSRDDGVFGAGVGLWNGVGDENALLERESLSRWRMKRGKRTTLPIPSVTAIV